MGKSLYTNVGNTITGLIADAHPSLREGAKPPLILTCSKNETDQKLHAAMNIFTDVSLHKLAVDVFHVRMIRRVQILFDGNGGQRRHRDILPPPTQAQRP